MVKCESRPSRIGHITLDTKQTGAPSAGNPHAGCDVAGAGNGFTVGLLRHSQRKRGATDRPDLRNTAPVLDPTAIATGISRLRSAMDRRRKWRFPGVVLSSSLNAGVRVVRLLAEVEIRWEANCQTIAKSAPSVHLLSSRVTFRF
jgi:hypothetical protein